MVSPMQDLCDLTGGDWGFLVKVIGGPENVRRLKRGELEISLKEIMRILPCTKPFDPASFIGSGWKFEDGESKDVRMDIDWCKVRFEHYLKEGETTITGEEKLKRINASGDTPFGAKVFFSLWQDYQKNKENSVLEWLYRTHGIIFMDFFRDVLRRPRGSRCVLYLFRDADEWDADCSWLDDDWNAGDVSGVPASQPSNA